ncbi:hypothetical protein B0I35DRAFT_361901 [Stachybotrys elegans]|uniref:Carrier domain-containing protein n=1 Tax=Stachybotrys elegans TaxID=80388 RepID=A0A8K0SGH9_9HYPO|nr:hypothetical protein B0I35DRAFT_361901 [Stachybotrys elegans]
MAATVLLFGDQTDSWVEGLDQLCKQAASTPWLHDFLDGLAAAIKSEASTMTNDRTLQECLGHFSSLQELADRYRSTDDELGVVRALLHHTVRAGTLLQWARREPGLLSPDSPSEWIGISGGIITLSALAISDTFEALLEACIDVSRVLVRFCKLTSVRSRAVEDQPGVWGWAILGISAADLTSALDQFQKSAGIPAMKRAKVAVSGNGWHTVIGPPSVLQLFVNRCPAVKALAKNSLDIKALQHTLTISDEDVEYIVGQDAALLSRPITCPNHLWGMDEPDVAYTNFGDLLRAVTTQVLSRPLDITRAVSQLDEKLDGMDAVRIIQLGTSSHAPYMAGVFKASGRDVAVLDAKSLLPAEDATTPPPPGRIAIVGMAGRGPGSDNVDEFWDLIMSKQDLCSEVPKDRFDIDEFYCTEHGQDGRKCTMTTRYGCFMKNPGHFDTRFFHISPREALLMDPGHRQFLMATYEALEMAGYSDGRTRPTDPNRIAAFFGQCSDDWHDASHPSLGCDSYTLQGEQRAFGPGRLAWHFKWEGPTYSFDSACASTTASIHLACMSLLSGDVDMAVAGAVNILSYPHSFTLLSKSGVLSDTGNCKPFRDDADGYCRGDFVGAVVLKRLEDAVAQHDNILAVVAASGRNHSGNSTSITTSDAGAQERLFRKVMRNAQISPSDVSYVEMHGTGTQVGDPAEMSAVANTFRDRRLTHDTPLRIGGVKGNFGHSEAAAGMAGLLKCIKMLQTDTIPPQAGMPHALNPRFPPLGDLGIEIPAEPSVFHKASVPRRILLNNFDAAGGNACIILEDYKPPLQREPAPRDPRQSHVVVTSARTQLSFDANRRKLAEWLQANPDARLEDIAYTTTARRMHHPFRFACAASTTQELIAKLQAPEATAASPVRAIPVVFVFTGQGSHYAGMGAELYHTSPTFRETVHLCVSICQQHGFPPFLDLITNGGIDMASQTTLQTQLAVLTLEIALAAFWKSAGVLPSMVMGHSLGEYAALHVAGVLSLADVLYLVGQRAKLLLERCEANTCAMLSVSMPPTDVQGFLKMRPQYSSCGIACMNSPTATVVSGDVDEIKKVSEELTAMSKRSKVLAVPYGFHSFQMDTVLNDYVSLAEGVTYSAPRIPVASTLLGSVVDKGGVFNGRYLAQQTRQAVNFAGALRAAKDKMGDSLWLELGPSAVCSSFVRSTLFQATTTKSIMSTLEAPGRDGAWASVSKCLATAYTHGIAVDWYSLHAPYTESLKLVTLPAYAWDLKDYWVPYVEGGKERAALPAPAPVKEEMIWTCAQFVVNKSDGPKGKQVTLRASMADPGLSRLIEGHRMQDEAICPGSVFCESALAGATYALEQAGRKDDTLAGKLALRNPHLLRPLTKNLVGADGELHTTVVMKSASSNEIEISWKAVPVGSGASYDLGTCTVTVNQSIEKLQAGWDRMSYFIKARMDDIVSAAKQGNGHRFRPDIFYTLFSATVVYDPQYKGLKEAFISDDFSEAASEIVMSEDPSGTKFVSSPYWGENCANLAGFAVNANPQNQIDGHGTCFINGGFESFEQTAAFKTGQSYYTYVRVSATDKDTRNCDCFVFDSDYRLVVQCTGLLFHRIGNSALGQVLSRKSKVTAPRAETAVPKTVVQKEVKKVEAPVVPVAAPKPAQQVIVQEETTTSGPAETFRVLLESIAKETGIDVSELTDDVAPAEVGVDSIMAIEVTANVSSATGLELRPSFLVEHQTIGDLRRALKVIILSADSSAASTPAETVIENVPLSSPAFEYSQPPPQAAAPIQQEVVPVVEVEEVEEDIHVIDESSPAPKVRIMLLKGGVSSVEQPPFFLFPDGTGSIASYIHLPAHIKSGMRIYGVDSPFLKCPTRMVPDVGIESAATLIIEAILKKQPEGAPFWIGGFSGGATIAYEASRQLVAAGHTVDGLMLIDMAPPRPVKVPPKSDLGFAMFEAAFRGDFSGVWKMSDQTLRHQRALFASVAQYTSPTLKGSDKPPAKRTYLIWAERGMIGRCEGDAGLMKMLAEQGISTKAYPGFMEDPKLGSVGWSLAHKTEGHLGPNGWEKYVGRDTLVVAHLEGDHLDLPTPGYVHQLGETMDKAFQFFKEG